MPYGTPSQLRSFATENVAGPVDGGVDFFGNRTTILGFGAGTDAGDASVPRPVNDSVFIGHDAGRGVQQSNLTIVGAGSLSSGLVPAAQALDGATLIGRNLLPVLDTWSTLDGGAPIMLGSRIGTAVTGQGGAGGTRSVVAIGQNIMSAIDSSGGGPWRNNVLIGHDILVGTTTPPDNCTAVGTGTMGALAATGQPQNCTAVGTGALARNNVGIDNTAVGSAAGEDITGGDDNVMVGRSAGANVSTGDRNTVIGGEAGVAAVSECTVVGFGSGSGFGTGDDSNTVLGHSAAGDATLQDRNIIIGESAGDNSVPIASDQLIIENSAGGLLYGDTVNGNLVIGAAKTNRAFGGGANVLKLQDGTAPGANPVAGGYLSVVAGALSYRGSGGTITPLAPA